jgi:hypothetical protein
LSGLVVWSLGVAWRCGWSLASFLACRLLLRVASSLFFASAQKLYFDE